MLETALSLDGPAMIRFPKTPARQVRSDQVGSGLSARRVRAGDGEVCILAVGKMLEPAEQAAAELSGEGIEATVWDVRVVKPADPAMVADASRHRLVVPLEDGIRVGGAGSYLADKLAGMEESRRTPPVLSLGVPVAYIAQAKPAQILTELGLDASGVAASIRKVLGAIGPAPTDLDLASAPLDLD